MTSNQFAFLVFILLLGFGGYLSHPILPPEIGIPLLVLFILGVMVVAIGAVICDQIAWWWRFRDFRRETRKQRQEMQREELQKMLLKRMEENMRKRRQ